MAQNLESNMTRLYVVTLLVSLTCRVHHEKRQASEAKAEIKNPRRNINYSFKYADDTLLMAEI